MTKRADIIAMLNTVNIERIESDGPTSIFFSFKGNKRSKTFGISVQKDFVVVTTGKFLFKRKYRINKNELLSGTGKR
jgi:hypothetical protein